jgi:DNA-binding NarL/FixJ family response regulator
MTKPIHIGIVDDHLVLRQGLVSLLKEYDNLNIIISEDNGKELMAALKNSKPDIILLDIEMPVMNGREALEKIKIKYPKIKVIMMSQYFDDSYIVEFIKNGACAFLPKNCDIEKIVDAIHMVYEHGHYYDNKVSAAMAAMLKKSPSTINEVVPDTEFTKREVEILKLICAKKSNIDIAEELSLSVRTIEGHRYNISKKTNTSNTIELIEYAIHNNILKIS